MRCAYCGVNNPIQNKICFACHRSLSEETNNANPSSDVDLQSAPRIHRFSFLGNLFTRIQLSKANLKEKKEAWNLRYGLLSRAWLAGWLSLFPGLGQLYNGQKLKALVLFLSFTGLLTTIYITIYQYISNWFLYGVFILIAYSFMDAFICNLTIHHKQNITTRQKISVVFYGLFLFGTTLMIGQWVLYPAFRFVYMNNNNLHPFIQRSDRILVNRIPYWFHEPKRGDIVWYKTGEFVAIDYPGKDITGELIENRYIFTNGSNMEKILALPGETILFSNKTIYINDKPLPAEYYPLVFDVYPNGFKYTLPSDSYFMLMSRIPKFGDTISDSVIRHGIFGLFPNMDATAVMEPHKAIIRDTKNWLKACVIQRDMIIGKSWLIYDPPPRRRFLDK